MGLKCFVLLTYGADRFSREIGLSKLDEWEFSLGFHSTPRWESKEPCHFRLAFSSGFLKGR